MKSYKTRESLEKAVRTQLRRSGLSNNNLAGATGLSATSIQYFKTDERRLSLESLMRLADHFRVPYLFRGPA